MKLLALLMPVLSIVALAAFIWLTVVAFKRSTLWGVLVLLLSPFSAVIFAVKFWEESKKPFLLYAGSVVGSVALMVAMFSFMGGFTMMAMAKAAEEGNLSQEEVNQFVGDTLNKMENSGTLDEQEQAQLDEMKKMFQEGAGEENSGDSQASVEVLAADASQATAGATPALKVRSEPAPAAQIAAVAPGGVIHMRHANDYVGKYLRVRLNDGNEYLGTLASFGSDGLQLERSLPGGVVTIHVDRSNVRTLQLAKR